MSRSQIGLRLKAGEKKTRVLAREAKESVLSLSRGAPLPHFGFCRNYRNFLRCFVILVKPIGILTHVTMRISFGTKIPTFVNISVLLKIVGISMTFLVLRF